jgi:prevent-host-death family protein
MLRTISVSDLRAQIRRILNEVGYGQSEYIIEKFGEPAAAIISMEDFQLLQEIRQQRSMQPKSSFLQTLGEIHQRLEASGYKARTKQEIDAQLQAERKSWE